MNFTILDCEQRSEMWFAARCGRLTGSQAADMLARIKTGEAAGRRDLRTKLVCERLTGKPQEDDYISKEMQRGIDLETTAFGEYEAITGVIVERTGFLSMNDKMVGCSLDGHVNNFEGIVEFKCPKSATHLKYLRSVGIPSDHYAQCLHNLWVSGAQWCDFASYDDRFPADLQLHVVRMPRVEKDITAYALAVELFLAEVDAEVLSIQKLRKAA